MDSSRPFKVVKVPLRLGVCAGIQGEVLDEYPTEGTAMAMMYEKIIADTSEDKGIYYSYEVAYWNHPE